MSLCKHQYMNNSKNYQRGDQCKTKIRKNGEEYCFKHKGVHNNNKDNQVKEQQSNENNENEQPNVEIPKKEIECIELKNTP